jgi:hypothetical protein
LNLPSRHVLNSFRRSEESVLSVVDFERAAKDYMRFLNCPKVTRVPARLDQYLSKMIPMSGDGANEKMAAKRKGADCSAPFPAEYPPPR